MASGKEKCVLDGKFILKEDKGKKVAICTFCDEQFNYHHSTTTLSYHLEKKHPFTSSIAASSATSSNNCESIISSSSSGSNQQQSILAYTVAKKAPKAVEQAITKQLCVWVCSNLRPISIVEDEGLVELLKIATQDPQFKVPGRTSTTEKIKDLYHSKALQVQATLNSVEEVVLALDYWTSISNHSYLGVVAFFIKDWKLSSVTLAIDPSDTTHTSEHIQQQVEELIKEWKLQGKVKYIISDNARNITKAIRLMGLMHFPCMAHTIQLSINHAIDEAGISTTLAKCRKIVGHFRHSSSKMAELKSVQSDSQPDQGKSGGLVS